MQKESRFPFENWDSQIIIEPSRLVIDRFRWKPDGQTGLCKKVSDFGAKGVDETVDPSLDGVSNNIYGIYRHLTTARWVWCAGQVQSTTRACYKED